MNTKGEVTCKSLLGVKGLIIIQLPLHFKASFPNFILLLH